MAADTGMPLMAPPPPGLYDWSGLYIGGVAGGGWSSNDFCGQDPAFMPDGRRLPLTQSVNNSSWLAGAEAGWSYQINRLVVGGEWDFTWADMNGSNTAGYGFNAYRGASEGTEEGDKLDVLLPHIEICEAKAHDLPALPIEGQGRRQHCPGRPPTADCSSPCQPKQV